MTVSEVDEGDVVEQDEVGVPGQLGGGEKFLAVGGEQEETSQSQLSVEELSLSLLSPLRLRSELCRLYSTSPPDFRLIPLHCPPSPPPSNSPHSSD